MFKKSTPFWQFAFIFKLLGFQPSKISKRHKIVAFLAFIPCELIYGLLMILPIFQFGQNSEFIVQFVFQSSFIVSIWVKMIYYFCNFKTMENFKIKMCELFDNCDGNFVKAFKTSKMISLPTFVSFLTLGAFAAVFSFVTESKIIQFWTPPIAINAKLLFFLHWFEETIGIFYNVLVYTTMELYPFCIMIMFKAYLVKLNQKFRNARNKTEFLKCMKMHGDIKVLVSEFQDIFSPLLFVQAFSLLISFCVTLLITTSSVS